MSLNKILNAVRGVSDEYAVLYRQGRCFIVLPHGNYDLPKPDGERLKGNYVILRYIL